MANRLPRISAASLLACLLLCAAEAMAAGAGIVTHLSGTLSVKRADGTTKLLAVKSEVFPGDVLTTEQETYARVKFVDGGEVVLRPASQMKLDAYAFSENQSGGDNAVMSLLKGGFRAVTGLIGKRNHDNVHYSTPTATIGIRGTHFGALYCNNDCGGIPTTSGQAPANGLHVDVATGAVSISNGAGSVQVNMGQFAFVSSPNASPVIVPPQQGIQVTMPTNISQNKGSGQGIGQSKNAECSL
jgi:hypothetical protein